jgi:hypothetical protein
MVNKLSHFRLYRGMKFIRENKMLLQKAAPMRRNTAFAVLETSARHIKVTKFFRMRAVRGRPCARLDRNPPK